MPKQPNVALQPLLQKLVLTLISLCVITLAGCTLAPASSQNTPTVSLSVTPNSVSLQAGKNQQFTATITGTTNTAVNWSATGGTVNSSGRYTAPTAAGSYVVKATSMADSTVSASATVTVTAPIAVTISPVSASLLTNGTQQFTATVSGSSNTAVTWSASGGSISSSGFYTAPATAGTFTVTATSAADNTKSASASVTVSAAPPVVGISITPTSASLVTGGTQQFTAAVTGTSNTAVSWSASGGSVSSSGMYTAPSTAGTYTVTATSAANTSKTASATVSVSAPTVVAISVSPTSSSLLTGGTQQFTATVSGTSNTAVTWSATGGSVSSSGLYTAPSSAGSYTVKATSAADSTKSASATVSVAAAPVVAITVSPTSASLLTGGTQQFTATVTGSSNTTVTWSATGGSLSSGGLYTAPSSAGTFTVTATSMADSTKSASATVTVSVPVITITVAPTSVSLLTNATQQFTATITGSSNTGVAWSATGGSVSASGLYTAPNTAGTYTVKASSVADSTKSASASVTVSSSTGPVSVSIAPGSASLGLGATQQFTATVSGTSNTAVTWSASEGSISSTGLYTSPNVAGVYTVTATSAADSTQSSSVNVAVGASFFDDFTGTALDTTVWYVFNGPDGWSGDDCFQPANVTVSGGNLIETALVQSACGYSYTTGQVSWKTFNFTYGVVQYRAKFAGLQGPWPAVWLLGAACQPTGGGGSCNWPNDSADSAEIDITEVKGNLTNPWQNLDDEGGWQTCEPTVSPDVTHWHVYQLDWSPGLLVWKVDGATTCTFTSHVPTKAMYMMIDLYMGSAGGSIDNSTSANWVNTIDYVAVFPNE